MERGTDGWQASTWEVGSASRREYTAGGAHSGSVAPDSSWKRWLVGSDSAARKSARTATTAEWYPHAACRTAAHSLASHYSNNLRLMRVWRREQRSLTLRSRTSDRHYMALAALRPLRSCSGPGYM